MAFSWETLISHRRFEEFLAAARYDRKAALDLYAWDAKISAAFLEVIAYLEVALRNAIDAVMCDLEIPEKLAVQPHKAWWFNHPGLLEDAELKFFDAADRRLPRIDTGRKRRQHRDKYLASLTFGLWVNLFTKNYDALFAERLVYAFPERPRTGFQRKTVHKPLNGLYLLRNRIGHHQPIFGQPLEEMYQAAYEMLGWISKDLQKWVDQHQSVTELLELRPQLDDPLVVVVPASENWEIIQKTRAYVCKPDRFFRSVSHIAFYVDRAIQPEIYKIERRIDDVSWDSETIRHLYNTNERTDRHLGEVIVEHQRNGFDAEHYQVFLLSSPGDKGHVTLENSLSNQKRGPGSGWVRLQRYVSLQDLKDAKHLSELG